MNKKIAFAGHSNFRISYEEMRNRIYDAIKEQIKKGYFSFIVGTYGNFDKQALLCCRNLRKEFANLTIEVVLTSLNQIKPKITYSKWGSGKFVPYDDVATVFYDIEDTYFKKRIIKSNQYMIDDCDLLISYINTKKQIVAQKEPTTML